MGVTIFTKKLNDITNAKLGSISIFYTDNEFRISENCIFDITLHTINMPEISRFLGIIIKMFFDDHNPPHFHAEFQEYKAIIEIHTSELLEGYLPPKQLKLVQAWAIIHEEELLENFTNLNKDFKSWNKIDPL